ncbi:MAG: polysaccharide lyase family 7 protein [Pseudomonadota bacterium]
MPITPTPQLVRKARLGAVLLAAWLSSAVQAALYPDVPPGGNFALQHWNLRIPADSDGGSDGPALVLPAEQLSGNLGYQSPWFSTASDGAMTFWTPVNGALANGVSTPRTELRERRGSSELGTSWSAAGHSQQEALVKVLQVPNDGTVIIGQVQSVGRGPLILLYYRYDALVGSGRVIARLQGLPQPGQPYSTHTLASDVRLGQSFSYQLQVSDNVASASVNGGPAARSVMDPAWIGTSFYFKAGAQLQGRGDSPSEGARVKFYRLAASHPNDGLLINSQGVLPDARVDQPYLVQLYSTGGRGGATWTLLSGHPPEGLVLDADGLLHGIPNASAASDRPQWFMVQVRDVHGSTHAKTFSLRVAPASP